LKSCSREVLSSLVTAYREGKHLSAESWATQIMGLPGEAASGPILTPY